MLNVSSAWASAPSPENKEANALFPSFAFPSEVHVSINGGHLRAPVLSNWASISMLEKLVVLEVAPNLDLSYSTQSEPKARVAVATDRVVLRFPLSDTKVIGNAAL